MEERILVRATYLDGRFLNNRVDYRRIFKKVLTNGGIRSNEIVPLMNIATNWLCFLSIGIRLSRGNALGRRLHWLARGFWHSQIMVGQSILLLQTLSNWRNLIGV